MLRYNENTISVRMSIGRSMEGSEDEKEGRMVGRGTMMTVKRESR